MKTRLLKYAFLLSMTLNSIAECTAQKKTGPTAPILTANELASGNYKDILTSFFQLGFDNLIGPN